jgi:hypothetical protein
MAPTVPRGHQLRCLSLAPAHHQGGVRYPRHGAAPCCSAGARHRDIACNPDLCRCRATLLAHASEAAKLVTARQSRERLMTPGVVLSFSIALLTESRCPILAPPQGCVGSLRLSLNLPLVAWAGPQHPRDTFRRDPRRDASKSLATMLSPCIKAAKGYEYRTSAGVGPRPVEV